MTRMVWCSFKSFSTSIYLQRHRIFLKFSLLDCESIFLYGRLTLQKLLVYSYLWSSCNVGYNVATVDFS